MPIAHGTHLNGIRTIEDLKLRCYICEDTGCWHWRMGSSNGRPCVMFVMDGVRKKAFGRRAALMLAGKYVPKGHEAFAKEFCKSVDCVNPDHTRLGTRRQRCERSAANGVYSTAERRARLLVHNASRAKTTPEQRFEIAMSKEPSAVVAERFGITLRRVNAIRRTGPRPMVVNSVFNLGG